MLDPEKIVLGGGLSNIAQLCEALPAQIERPQIRPIAGFARRAMGLPFSVRRPMLSAHFAAGIIRLLLMKALLQNLCRLDGPGHEERELSRPCQRRCHRSATLRPSHSVYRRSGHSHSGAGFGG